MTTVDAPERLQVRGRLVRPVAVLWALAGGGLLAGELVRLLDVGDLGWQLIAGMLASALAWRLWHAEAMIDEHGIEVADVRGRRRVLWSTIDTVEVDLGARLSVPMRVRRRDGALVTVDGTWGMRRSQREALAASLGTWAGPHGVEVVVVRPS